MKNIIFARYWNICLLRESPENTPFSYIRMLLSAFVLILLMIFEWRSTQFNSSNDVMMATGLVCSYFIYTYAVLQIKGLTSRWVQTTTSLYCMNIIIHILVVPLLLLSPFLSQIHLKNPFFLFLGVLYLFLSIGVTVWQFVITAHIYKYALNTTAIQSVLVAFGLIAVNILTVSLLQ